MMGALNREILSEARAAGALRSAASGALRDFADKAIKGNAGCYAHGQRLYVAERNLARWPDGRYRLLGRDYGPWRGHDIAVTGEELQRAGYGKLSQYLSGVGAVDGILAITPERYMRRAPREFRRVLAAFALRLADVLEARR